MKKSIAATTLALSTMVFAFSAAASASAYGQVNTPESGTPGAGFNLTEDAMNFGFNFNIPDINFGDADEMVETYNSRLFEDESAVEKEVISGAGISGIKLNSIEGALYIEASPDENIHLAYPSDANFTVEHEVTERVLNVTSKVDTPGNSDVLKVYIPSGTVKQLDVVGGTSMIHFVGQYNFLTTCSIDVTLATVILENVYADTTVKTTSGTIRLKNETVRSNISLKSQYGVVDVALGELPDDVSIYTTGRAVNNTLLGARADVSPNEKYAVRVENSVGGVNIHKAE